LKQASMIYRPFYRLQSRPSSCMRIRRLHRLQCN
jgi:hypothetical protein